MPVLRERRLRDLEREREREAEDERADRPAAGRPTMGFDLEPRGALEVPSRRDGARCPMDASASAMCPLSTMRARNFFHSSSVEGDDRPLKAAFEMAEQPDESRAAKDHLGVDGPVKAPAKCCRSRSKCAKSSTS